MARSIRIEYPGAHYHVMARGNRREAIFAGEEDRRFFLHALGQACEMTGWRVHAWVLMSNHYHLLIETPEANLVVGMKWLQNSYTRRFNTRHRKWGRLFGDRYKAVVVETEDGDYFGKLCDYIHLNPVRARLIRTEREQSVSDYPWSSIASGYALAPRKRAPWLETGDALATFGLEDTAAGRRQFVQRLDRRACEEPRKECGVPLSTTEDARRSDLRRGWYWGSVEFAEKLLELAKVRMKAVRNRTYRGGAIQKTHDVQAAERLVREGLKESGLREKDLAHLPGSDARKLKIAQKVWRQTSVSQGWIAERLQMRSAANVSQQLRRYDGLSIIVN